MTGKRFTTDAPNSLSEIYDDGCVLTNKEVVKYVNWYREDMRKFSVENEQLKSEITGLHQLIKNAYESERTDLGKSVLKQLLNQMNE